MSLRKPGFDYEHGPVGNDMDPIDTHFEKWKLAGGDIVDLFTSVDECTFIPLYPKAAEYAGDRAGIARWLCWRRPFPVARCSSFAPGSSTRRAARCRAPSSTRRRSCPGHPRGTSISPGRWRTPTGGRRRAACPRPRCGPPPAPARSWRSSSRGACRWSRWSARLARRPRARSRGSSGSRPRRIPFPTISATSAFPSWTTATCAARRGLPTRFRCAPRFAAPPCSCRREKARSAAKRFRHWMRWSERAKPRVPHAPSRSSTR